MADDPQDLSDAVNFAPPATVRRASSRGRELLAGYTGDPTALSDATAWADAVAAGMVTPDLVKRAVGWFRAADGDDVANRLRRRDKTSAAYVGWMLFGGKDGQTWALRVAEAMAALDRAGVSGGTSAPAQADPPAPPAPAGVAVVLPLRPEEGVALAHPQGLAPEDLHVTLAYVGKLPEVDGVALAAVAPALAALASATGPIEARVSGMGRFEGVGDDETDAVVALVSSPDIDALRAKVVAALTAAGLSPAADHGFTSHVTVAYAAPGADLGVPAAPLPALAFDRIALWVGAERTDFPLTGRTAPSENPMTPTLNADSPAVPVAMGAGRVVPFDTGEGEPLTTDDWNANHTLGRLRAWASEDGSGDYAKLDAEKLARAFAWYDPASAAKANVNAYRLPHHDAVGGQLRVSLRGLQAAARRIMGEDHGIPAEDLDAVKAHLARHFAQFNMDPPWMVRSVDGVEVALADPTDVAPGTVNGVVSTSWIQVAKVGTYRGHPQGAFEFNPVVFEQIIVNFRATDNRRVPVDYEHASEILNDSTLQKGAPAVGWIVDLENRGGAGLWGRVEWVDAEAVGYVRSGRYRYFSPAVAFNAINRTTGEPQGPTIVSGALTNRPFLDGMVPVTARHGEAADTLRVSQDPQPESAVGAGDKPPTEAAPALVPEPLALSDAQRTDLPALDPAAPTDAPAAAFTAVTLALPAERAAELRRLAACSFTGSRLTRREALLYALAAETLDEPQRTERLRSIAGRVVDDPAEAPVAMAARDGVDGPHPVAYQSHEGVDGAWSADDAVARLRAWAGVDVVDPPNTAWDKYAQGFGVVDGPRQNLGSYKLPHHDVRDGELVTVARGVSAALAALHGARAEMDLPAAVAKQVETHLETHRKEDIVGRDVLSADGFDSLQATDGAPASALSVVTANTGSVTPADVTTPQDIPTTPQTPEVAPLPAAEPQAAANVSTLREALAAAWETPAPASALRTLGWYGDDIDDLGDLLELLRYMLGLPKTSTAQDVLAAFDTLAAYVEGDMGVRDGVPVRDIVGNLRCVLNLPVITPAQGVVAAILRKLADLRPAPVAEPAAVTPASQSPAAPMSVGPGDVHVPSAGPQAPTEPENTMDLSALATACGLAADASIDAITERVTTLSADRARLSDALDRATRTQATETVDALIGRGLIAASGRDKSIAMAMGDLDGFRAMFPAQTEKPTAPAVPSRETATTLSAPVTGAASGGAQPPAPRVANPEPPQDVPAPGTRDYSARLYSAAVAHRAQNTTLTLRAAMDAVESTWAAQRATRG